MGSDYYAMGHLTLGEQEAYTTYDEAVADLDERRGRTPPGTPEWESLMRAYIRVHERFFDANGVRFLPSGEGA